MKKITLKLMSKLALVVTLLFSTFSANADTDLGELKINTVYDCPSFNYVRGSFCPESSGAFRINYSSSDRFAIYTDAELLTPYENGGDWAYASETIETMKSMGYETWNFEAGTTYYFGGSAGSGLFIMNSGAQFVITPTSSDITISNVTPAEKSAISTGGKAQIDVAFSSSVILESVLVEAAGQSETFAYSDDPDSKVRVYGNNVSIVLKDLLQSWYDADIIKGGEELLITLNGLCSASDNTIVYGEDGKLTLEFVVAEEPAVLVSSTNTPDQVKNLKSYYFEDDANGSITLTFNRQLLSDPNDMPVAVWGVGNKESETGDYYEETIPGVVDGNTLIINLQGKLRNASTMGLSMNYTSVQIDIKNVKSADGQYVYSEGSGKLGSFNYMYGLDYVETEVVAEFTPSKGEIYAGDELEIWIMGDSDLRYDGISFQYDDKEVVVTEFNKINDPEDEKAAIITLLVPELDVVENSTDLTVMLKNVKAADGLDHSNDVKATFTYMVKVSVNAIDSDAENVDVYNLNGVKVLSNASINDVKNLDKGVYIVNGKKVVIK